nr:alpha/beta hydrolase [Parvularcula mediterranea]
MPFGFPELRLVEAGEVTFSVHEAGPEDGLPLLMLHGWPELAFSWAPLVRPLTEAGYRLIMPDIKGFGASSKPTDPEAYRMSVIAEDYGKLLDALGLEKVVLVGHDWGGAIVWPMTQRLGERILGVASFCTPYPDLAPAPPLKIWQQKMGERFYINQFQDPQLPDRVFGGREEDFFRFIMRPGPPREVWPKLIPSALEIPDRFAEAEGPWPDCVLPEEAVPVYAEAYAASGHEGPTMVYRAIDLHWQERSEYDPDITVPALMVTATRDMMLPPEASLGMEKRVPNLSRAELDSGHWVMWEAGDAAAEALLGWLQNPEVLFFHPTLSI